MWDYWQIQEPEIWVIWNFFTKWSSIMVFIVLRWDVMYLFWNLWRKYHILFINIRISFHNLGHIFLIQCYFASTYFINIMIIHFIIFDKQYYELWQFLCWHHNLVGKRSNQPKPLCMATIYKNRADVFFDHWCCKINAKDDDPTSIENGSHKLLGLFSNLILHNGILHQQTYWGSWLG